MKTFAALVTAAALVAVGLLAGGPGSPAPAQDKAPAPVVMKWEYKRVPGEPKEAEMDKLGDDGWELVAAVPGTDRSIPHQLYKRPKR